MMSLSPFHILCWILDEAYDDYQTIWELTSIFQQRQAERSEADVHEQLRQGLNMLQEQGFVAFWEGVPFNGEEQPVTPEVTAAFIATHAASWKNEDWSVKQVKLYITDSGRAFYHTQCGRSLFAGIE